MIENFVSTLPNIFDVRFQVSDVAGIFAHFALHCVVQLIPTFQRFLGAPLDAQSSVFYRVISFNVRSTVVLLFTWPIYTDVIRGCFNNSFYVCGCMQTRTT